MLTTLFTGIVIGFSVAAPVGPIALLILRRALNEGRLSGFISGLGAATADFLCGIVSVFGLSAITLIVNSHHLLLQLFGGLFMLVLGVVTFRAKDPNAAKRPLHERNLFQAYIFTLLLTLSNPLTLVGMLGIVAAAGAGGPEYTRFDNAVVCSGILLGSSLWWLTLCSISGWLGRSLGNRTLHVINMLAGLVIFGFGLWQLVAFSLLAFRHA